MRASRHSYSCLTAIYLAGDVLAIVAAYLATLYLRFHSEVGSAFFTVTNILLRVRSTGDLDPSFQAFYIDSAQRIILFISLVVCFLYAYFGLYGIRRRLRPRGAGWSILWANFLALLLFYGYFYLSRNEFHPRSMFFTIMALNTVLAIAFRNLIAGALARINNRRRIFDCPVLLLGETHEANLIKEFIDAAHPYGLRIAAHLPLPIGESFQTLSARIRDACETHGASMVIVADKSLAITRIMEFLSLTGELDLPAKILSGHMAILVNQAQMPADMIMGIPLVHFGRQIATWRLRLGQRCGMLVAALGLILLAPLLLSIALLIKLTSRGPVFFIQERIGIDRRPFSMYKFRTMHSNAEEQQASIEEFNESGRGLFKIRRDPRITPVGRFLRRFSMDEVPQLLNVLKGEMNLVGPRPLPRRDYENYYEEWHYSRHAGLPGLTCLWQVSGRSDVDFNNMCVLDVYYLRNRNAMLDLQIIMRTFGVVLFAKGAY